MKTLSLRRLIALTLSGLLLGLFCAHGAWAQQRAPSNGEQEEERDDEALASELSDEAEEDADDSAESEPAEAEGSPGLGSLRRSNRMEFDARLIRGETAGSGAVFLFQRAPRALPSMVPLRTSYLQRSIDEVLTPSWVAPTEEAAELSAKQLLEHATTQAEAASRRDVASGASRGGTRP